MAAARSSRIREMLRIGQVWEHEGRGYSIRIKQIHRADGIVEAWFDTPRGPESHGVTFADLSREYELVR